MSKKKVVSKVVAKVDKKMVAKKAKILAFRAKGMTLAKIAAKVGLSMGGVAWHLKK